MAAQRRMIRTGPGCTRVGTVEDLALASIVAPGRPAASRRTDCVPAHPAAPSERLGASQWLPVTCLERAVWRRGRRGRRGWYGRQGLVRRPSISKTTARCGWELGCCLLRAITGLEGIMAAIFLPAFLYKKSWGGTESAQVGLRCALHFEKRAAACFELSTSVGQQILNAVWVQHGSSMDGAPSHALAVEGVWAGSDAGSVRPPRGSLAPAAAFGLKCCGRGASGARISRRQVKASRPRISPRISIPINAPKICRFEGCWPAGRVPATGAGAAWKQRSVGAPANPGGDRDACSKLKRGAAGDAHARAPVPRGPTGETEGDGAAGGRGSALRG